jgi:hypothetical protein
VDVGDRLAVEEVAHPVDEAGAVDVGQVEGVAVDDVVVVAGRGDA